MSTHKQFPVLLSVDITETNDIYLITADITGFRAENIKVTAWQDSLVINMMTAHEPDQSYYLGELAPEHYRRVIPLGFEIHDEDFNTHYTAGVLKIYIRKPRTPRHAIEKSSDRAVA
ncbi:MAG: Hsp20/alpha crystallin family protein [Granulosicoccus sp.]